MMIRVAVFLSSIACSTLLIFLSVCLVDAASITYGQNIDIDGSVKLLNSGNAIIFSDGTSMTSALVADGTAIWGQISGILTAQTDLQNALDTKATLDAEGKLGFSVLPILTETSSAVYDAPLYVPVWLINSDWQNFNDAGSKSFINHMPVNAIMSVIWSDNVAVYADNVSGNFCNIGLFLDFDTVPFCFGSWSGVYGYISFNQQSLICPPVPVSSGFHVISVKHRSDNCSYGSYNKDQFSTQRFLSVELRRAE